MKKEHRKKIRLALKADTLRVLTIEELDIRGGKPLFTSSETAISGCPDCCEILA